MKVLLDTSYLLPFIEVELETITKETLKKVIQQKDMIYVFFEINIFEIVAKGMKIAMDSELTITDIQSGVDTILHHSPLQPIPWVSHPRLLNIAMKFRKILKDTIDCLIFATGLFYADCIATFDDTFLRKIRLNKEISKFVMEANPNLKIWIYSLEKEPLLFSDIEI
jgi:hypothetical protein